MNLSDIKIGTRLNGAFALILLLLVGLLATALWQLGKIDAAKAVMVDASQRAKLAVAWREGVATNGVRTLARARSADVAEQQLLDQEMKTVSAQVSKLQATLETLVTSEQGKARLQAVAQQRKVYSTVRSDLFKRQADEGATPAFKAAVSNQLVPEMQKYLATVDDVATFEDSLFREANTRIDQAYTESKKVLIAIGALALCCGIALGLLLTRSITRPLTCAVSLAQRVAAGDLTADIQVRSSDEVGILLASLKHMNDSLLRTVSEVRSGTDTILTASQQIAAGNLDLSARTEQQASALEQTASSMEELTSTVRQNADHARQANALAATTSSVAAKGGDVVSRVVVSMASITASSKKIAEIIGVIDSIAFQTNILALNAAVEAARAGEQGRGFAVVASEVRTLAQRSAAAAKEIRGLISASVDQVDLGSQLVEQAGATMHEIVHGITRVTDIMSEIASASAEQTVGIEQVSKAITQMDDVTQQNAALVEEAASAAKSLEEQAASLSALVSTFTLNKDVHGHASVTQYQALPGAASGARRLAVQ